MKASIIKRLPTINRSIEILDQRSLLRKFTHRLYHSHVCTWFITTTVSGDVTIFSPFFIQNNAIPSLHPFLRSRIPVFQVKCKTDTTDIYRHKTRKRLAVFHCSNDYCPKSTKWTKCRVCTNHNFGIPNLDQHLRQKGYQKRVAAFEQTKPQTYVEHENRLDNGD